MEQSSSGADGFWPLLACYPSPPPSWQIGNWGCAIGLLMFVLVGVGFLPVPVFMGVYMGVLVGMVVLVFMGAFHIKPSFVDFHVGSCGEEILEPLSAKSLV